MNLRFREDFSNKIHWLLHNKGMALLGEFHYDSCADDVSSRGNVQKQVLAS
jgi:hypothetical protein